MDGQQPLRLHRLRPCVATDAMLALGEDWTGRLQTASLWDGTRQAECIQASPFHTKRLETTMVTLTGRSGGSGGRMFGVW
jgi:hypothetical protein